MEQRFAAVDDRLDRGQRQARSLDRRDDRGTNAPLRPVARDIERRLTRLEERVGVD